ncbi:MAG: hypothetical protein HY055_14895 [Magnetospirillum sp.]|nr:hypothetical protein [Magnetospirillum sp.]
MPDITRHSAMPPTKLSPQAYTSAVANHLKTFEGAVPRIYTDDYGIPTMGSGVALAVRNGSGSYTLRDLGTIGGEISGDPAKPYRFTPTETKLLNDTVGKLNDPKLDPDAQKREAKALIPEYKPGTESADKNKFGFTLSDERITKQAETAWAEHRERAFDTVRQQADKRGWSKEETDSYIESLKGSSQEVALTSMAFNAVRAPKATGAMLDNDPATMRKEILYNSNADESRGIANRRRAEADLATGSPSNWSEADQRKWQGVENSPSAKAYRKAYPNAFSDKTSSLTPEEAEAQGMTAGQYLVAKQMERDAQKDAGRTPSPTPGTQVAALDNPDVKTDWVEPTGQAKPGGNLLDTANQTGGLANEAEETQKAADQVKDEGATEQTANIDSRIQAMREMAAQPIDHPGKSALLKPVDKWTESEMKDVLNSAQGDFTGWQSGDPLKARMYEAVQDWHTNTYGDGEQKFSGGKPLEPSPIKPLNIVAMPHTTPQGEDLWKASSRMGDKLGTIAETDGYGAGVKAMQRGINMVNEAAGQPERSLAWGDYTPQEALKVDGEYGPKTDFALKDTLARHGMPKAGKADGLDQGTRDIFGPLYGGSDAPNGVLQETLNKVGGNSIEGWQDLKVDDWIGPKTTDAFAQVMDQGDPEDFTRGFGQGLGLL